MRVQALAVMMTMLAAAFAAALAPAQAIAAEVPAYRFREGQPISLEYELGHDAAWESAGDAITFQSGQTWDIHLTPGATRAAAVPVTMIVSRLRAVQSGPAGEQRFDSRDGLKSTRQPLMQHLHALVGTPILWQVDPNTGFVAAASGSQRLVAKLNELAPATMPGEPPPLEALAQSTFSDEALARLGDGLLRFAPLAGSATEAFRLGAPLDVTVTRVWSGNRWSAFLPASASTARITIGSGPAAISGVISNLRGSGMATPEDGRPARAEGEWSWTFTATALTQPMTCAHRLRWRMTPLVATP